MCGGDDRAPDGNDSAGAHATAARSVAEALRMTNAGLDYLNGPAGAGVDAAALGEVLVALGEIGAKFTAAHAAFLCRFDSADAHDADGYGTSAAWLAAKTRMTKWDARTAVQRMRQLGKHPGIGDALATGQISDSLAREIVKWTRKLPAELRAETDEILLAAAAAGASLDDLTTIAAYALEKWRSQHPDSDDHGFEDRFVQLGTTFGGAGCMRGDLTPECAAAVQAVLEALGKKRGPEDNRTEGQRFHDALQEGCELLIRAKMVPDRAGADTHVTVHVPLSQLREMPGASEMEAAWIAARLGEPGYLIGKDAETAACDALVIPVVTGHADMRIIDQIIELALSLADGHRHACGGDGCDEDRAASDTATVACPRPAWLSPEGWNTLRHAIARLAIDFVSGPNGLASLLRTQLLEPPFNTPSLPLDVGYSEGIPAHIRRAVILRDKHCAWPGGCDRPASASDVHHIVHKKDGGETSVASCALYCQFHHDVCIHRWGWQITLHPDGTSEARSPDGLQVLRSHAPPSASAA
jgi:hypothetical protein